MIISHKHKFIFIKPQKTAGTSVELLLSRFCGDDDIITPLGFDPDPYVRQKANARPPQNYFRKKPFKHWKVSEIYHYLRRGLKPNLNYWEHLQAQQIKDYVGHEIWNSYKKISIVRNPWDHAVSQYQWVKKYNYRGANRNFRDYIFTDYISIYPFLFINSEYIIDYIIKFENLESDCNLVLNKFNISSNTTIPITKNKTRKNKSYNEFYNHESSKKIYDINEVIIKKFNYEFTQ
jgi:hypothetical protein